MNSAVRRLLMASVFVAGFGLAGEATPMIFHYPNAQDAGSGTLTETHAKRTKKAAHKAKSAPASDGGSQDAGSGTLVLPDGSSSNQGAAAAPPQVATSSTTTASEQVPPPAPKVSASDLAAAKAAGQVWVNTDIGRYHKGGRWYGKTKQGKFMSEADAKKAGYRAAVKN